MEREPAAGVHGVRALTPPGRRPAGPAEPSGSAHRGARVPIPEPAADDAPASWSGLLAHLPQALAGRLQTLPSSVQGQVDEIRITAGQPLWVLLTAGEGFVTDEGALVSDPQRAPKVDEAQLRACLERMTASSWYAVQEQVRHGFLILPGGHRVGLAGEVQVVNGRIERFRHIRGLVIRRARAVTGCAADLLPRLLDGRSRGPGREGRRGSLLSALLIGPPATGKTTLLRDLVRLVSRGDMEGLAPRRVAVIDERGEIAAAGAFDLGPRTAVLEQCPKTAGLGLALRALSPEVLATDELGGPEDASAVAEAVRAGVTVLATAHAADLHDLFHRLQLRPLVRAAAFERIVVLRRQPRPGSWSAIYRRRPDGQWVPVDHGSDGG